MNICVIGTGYVGLVTGTVFADLGHKVYCVDIDESKIEKLLNGNIPFFEPGLQELVQKNLNQGRLIFTTSYEESVPNANVVFICVGTPPKENGDSNLDYLYEATKSTAKYLKDYTLIAIKSTVPIGVEKDLETLIKKNSDAEFELNYAPVKTPDGSPIRDYTNVVDLANAHILALEYLLSNEKSDVFNLGTGKGDSVLEIVDLVKKKTNVDFDVTVSKDRRKGEADKMIADISKAEKILHWKPTHSLEESIDSLIAWYKEHPKGWGD